MSLGCPGMEVVSTRWESISSLLRDYNPLGSRDIRVQSFDHVTSSNVKWTTSCQILIFLAALINTLRWTLADSQTHLQNGQVYKASSVNNGIARTCLVVDMVRKNWSRIVCCWSWVVLVCFGLFWFVLNYCEF